MSFFFALLWMASQTHAETWGKHLSVRPVFGIVRSPILIVYSEFTSGCRPISGVSTHVEGHKIKHVATYLEPTEKPCLVYSRENTFQTTVVLDEPGSYEGEVELGGSGAATYKLQVYPTRKEAREGLEAAIGNSQLAELNLFFPQIIAEKDKKLDAVLFDRIVALKGDLKKESPSWLSIVGWLERTASSDLLLKAKEPFLQLEREKPELRGEIWRVLGKAMDRKELGEMFSKPSCERIGTLHAAFRAIDGSKRQAVCSTYVLGLHDLRPCEAAQRYDVFEYLADLRVPSCDDALAQILDRPTPDFRLMEAVSFRMAEPPFRALVLRNHARWEEAASKQRNPEAINRMLSRAYETAQKPYRRH